MASAGRILIMPKGNWNAETEYEMLDLVFYNGTSWLAKKDIPKGLEPSENSVFWHCMFDFDPSSVYERLSAIENQMLSSLSFDEEGALELGDGKGKTYVTEYGAVFSAIKDEDNHRNLILGHPIMATSPDDYLKILDVVEGKLTFYKIFGEHNLPLLNNYMAHKANGGTMSFTANPNGNDYVIHTFNIEHQNDIMFFANTIATDDVFVTGINIRNYQPNSVEVRFALSKPYSSDIIFMVAYNKAL